MIKIISVLSIKKHIFGLLSVQNQKIKLGEITNKKINATTFERYQIIIAAVEPKNASALLGHQPGLHRIEGIGDGFIPDVLDPSIIDEIIEVSAEDAIQTSRRLAKEAGLLVGTSSGANVWAAMKLSERFGKNKVIVTILADRGERYFSTNLI